MAVAVSPCPWCTGTLVLPGPEHRLWHAWDREAGRLWRSGLDVAVLRRRIRQARGERVVDPAVLTELDRRLQTALAVRSAARRCEAEAMEAYLLARGRVSRRQLWWRDPAAAAAQ